MNAAQIDSETGSYLIKNKNSSNSIGNSSNSFKKPWVRTVLSPRFHQFDEVSSTNDVAIEMARAGEPEGAVVVARRQLEGRGRRGSRWVDDPGKSLLMSVVLTPNVSADKMSRLSFAASLGVAECLREVCGLDALVKWPNDVIAGDKKIAGILVEMVTARRPAAVVGVGLNVNQTSFSGELADIATSIAIETKRQWDIDRLKESVVRRVLREYDSFGEFDELLQRWRDRMWGMDARVEVSAEGRVARGIMLGVDSTGALVVGTDGGGELVVHAGDGLRVINS